MALETAADYPVYYAASEDNKVANWRPLAHWAMAIPHMFVAYVLSIVASICTFISWFAILITGKMPEGLANMIIMSQRYTNRTNAFYLGLTEQYPPFEFQATAEDPGDYAVRTDVRLELEGRNRLTVFFRFFMMIPLMFFSFFVGFAAMFVVLAAWFVVLFTGAYPIGMRNFVIKTFRLGTRINFYGSLITDQYPPFALE